MCHILSIQKEKILTFFIGGIYLVMCTSSYRMEVKTSISQSCLEKAQPRKKISHKITHLLLPHISIIKSFFYLFLNNLPEVRQEDDVVDRQAPGVEARGAVRVGATKQGLQFQKECGGARQQLGRLRNGLVVIESEFCGIFPNRIFGVAGICPVLNRHFCDARAHQRGDHLLEIFAPRVQVAPSRCGGDATRDAGRDVGADFE
mmetsp:Transcript_26938/g.62075  ORF Transcript_26938/g.62075 Transcript_26938/m.62075 type:complete len:203 (-) Transcript_26938:340-948(-)